MKRALVLGGSGFLGSHVADALSDAGYGVRLFDRVRSPHLRSGQEMVEGDLLDAAAVSDAAKGCEVVYNFAGMADINEAKTKPVDAARLNVIGNLHALEAARTHGAKRFVFASTVYVYSKSGAFYRASKQSCEHFVEAYFDQFKLPYTILRYGSLYGRRSDDRNGIHRFLKQALTEKKIVYPGSEESMREYIHVLDAARLSVQALSPQYENRCLLLTGPERMSVKSVMKMISEMIPGGVECTFTKAPDDAHYVMSPYTFQPKLATKLVATEHVEIGQGLLDCLAEIHEAQEGRGSE